MPVKRFHVMILAGTRPEVIKLWPVASALQRNGHFRVTAVHTGQHDELADQAIRSLKMKFHRYLHLMEPNQSLSRLTARVLERVGRELDRIAPDLVVVHGDTVTALASALAAFYQEIPVAHVEAGLRTHDLKQPFPEEACRVLADRLSALHFTPTRHSRKQLLREGISPRNIFVTGNTIVDAVTMIGSALPKRTVWPKPYLLVTLHRRENFRGVIRGISRILGEILHLFPQHHVVWPVHPNPNVRRQIDPSLRKHPHVHLCDPIPYRPFLAAMRDSELVVSDSGGVQEEAPALRKRVIVVRNVTERPEAVRAGWCRLAGTDSKKVKAQIVRALKSSQLPKTRNPFGDGTSGERIARLIYQYLKDR